MDLALYHQELGYYMRGDMRVGADGDFTTAPMLSSAFSQALAETMCPGLDVYGRGRGT